VEEELGKDYQDWLDEVETINSIMEELDGKNSKDTADIRPTVDSRTRDVKN
jgi:hypothetical protein